MLATVCFFGGPLVNKMGVKWALVVGAATFPIRGASYYCNSKFGNQWVSACMCLLSCVEAPGRAPGAHLPVSDLLCSHQMS